MARVEIDIPLIKEVNSIRWGVSSERSRSQMVQAQIEAALERQQGSSVHEQGQMGGGIEINYHPDLSPSTQDALAQANRPRRIETQGLNRTQS